MIIRAGTKGKSYLRSLRDFLTLGKGTGEGMGGREYAQFLFQYLSIFRLNLSLDYHNLQNFYLILLKITLAIINFSIHFDDPIDLTNEPETGVETNGSCKNNKN